MIYKIMVMKGVYLFLALLFNLFISYSQVGIGTTNPSRASMLEIKSTLDNGITHGGFLLPRVSSQTERDLINATSTDIGLQVFVENTGTFEIWNGIYWETIYTLSTQAITLAIQDFDTNIGWSYTLNPASTYNITNDIWDIVSTLGPGSSVMDIVSNNYLGCRDLNNPNGGGNFFHEISFVNIDVSGIINARIAFDYDVFEFDNGDDVQYEVFYDDVGQGIVTLVNGVGDLTVEGTETINIPLSTTNVRITLGIIQNGDGDFAGFDNFRLYGE